MSSPIYTRTKDASIEYERRMDQTYQFACRFAPSVDGKVRELIDHKGELTVCWIAKPNRFEEKVYETAWTVAGELGFCVRHKEP